MAYGAEQKNVKVTQKGRKLVIEIDLDQDHGPSQSGKTHVVATSDGLAYVEVDSQKWSLNLGLWKPVPRNGGNGK